MLAVLARGISATDPLDGLTVEEIDEPAPPPGWQVIQVGAASLNHHDLWALKGVGLSANRCPMVLGSDAAGWDEHGDAVVVYPVVAAPGWSTDASLSPGRTILSELHPGCLAERVAVPAGSTVPWPASLDAAEAACMGSTWLTAWRMLTRYVGLCRGDLVVVNGAAGGVATAVITIASAMGAEVVAVSRSADPRRREVAMALGAADVVDDARMAGGAAELAIDPVASDLSALASAVRAGGTVVVCGSADRRAEQIPFLELIRRELRIVGSTLGSIEELRAVCEFADRTGVRPHVHHRLPPEDVHRAMERMASGRVLGKEVVVFGGGRH